MEAVVAVGCTAAEPSVCDRNFRHERNPEQGSEAARWALGSVGLMAGRALCDGRCHAARYGSRPGASGQRFGQCPAANVQQCGSVSVATILMTWLACNCLPWPTNVQLRAAVRQREGLHRAASATSVPHRQQLPSVGSEPIPLPEGLESCCGVGTAYQPHHSSSCDPNCVSDPEVTYIHVLTRNGMRWHHVQHTFCGCRSVSGAVCRPCSRRRQTWPGGARQAHACQVAPEPTVLFRSC
jgi:hypothetical protein